MTDTKQRVLKRVIAGGLATVALAAAAGCAGPSDAASCNDEPFGPGCNNGHPVENDADRAVDDARNRDRENFKKAFDNVCGQMPDSENCYPK